jgi:hypothetical protein
MALTEMFSDLNQVDQAVWNALGCDAKISKIAG